MSKVVWLPLQGLVQGPSGNSSTEAVTRRKSYFTVVHCQVTLQAANQVTMHTTHVLHVYAFVCM